MAREQTSLLANEILRRSNVIRWFDRCSNQLSAVYRARDTFRNSSVQLNLRSQHKKAAKKQDGRLYRRTFSLHRVVCRLPGQLRHQVDQPSSRLPHRASQHSTNSRHRSQPSGNYPVFRCAAGDCYRLVYRAHRGMVNINYRADLRASQRYNLTASNSLLPATFAATIATCHIAATTATSNTSPLPTTPRPLPATLRRRRYR